MSDEMKLLRAFIEAQGFEIETIGGRAGNTASHSSFKVTRITKPLECYEPCVPLPVQSEAWGCIVDFVISHREDIVNDINDYGGLGFILDFMEGNKKDA